MQTPRYPNPRMDLKQALKEQYHAGLAMLGECVARCPDDLWESGEHPRFVWRIALHAAFFGHVYLVQNEAAYSPWPDRPRGLHEEMWRDPAHVEPFELPESAEALTRGEVLKYIAYVDGIVDSTLDALDLDTDESGYRWYPSTSKLSHELMNIRHIQGHVGQLSELLMARGIDIEWVGKRRPEEWTTWLKENP